MLLVLAWVPVFADLLDLAVALVFAPLLVALDFALVPLFEVPLLEAPLVSAPLAGAALAGTALDLAQLPLLAQPLWLAPLAVVMDQSRVPGDY